MVAVKIELCMQSAYITESSQFPSPLFAMAGITDLLPVLPSTNYGWAWAYRWTH